MGTGGGVCCYNCYTWAGTRIPSQSRALILLPFGPNGGHGRLLRIVKGTMRLGPDHHLRKASHEPSKRLYCSRKSRHGHS